MKRFKYLLAALFLFLLSVGVFAQARHLINKQTGTTYTITYADRAYLITQSNASSSTYTLPVFANGWFVWIQNRGAGTLTIDPSGAVTIDSASTLVLTTGQGVFIVSDGVNYFSERGVGGASGGDMLLTSAQSVSGAKTFLDATFLLRNVANTFNGRFTHTNTADRVYTLQNRDGTIADDTDLALKANLAVRTQANNTAIVANSPYRNTGDNKLYIGNFDGSANHEIFEAGVSLVNLTSNVTGVLPPANGGAIQISGTSALGTGAISSATCATVVTTTATGALTTDVVWWGFNGDPTGVTGYVPLTAGMLTIIAYPSSGNVNFKVCNNTTSSITPGAITLNWRIVR